LTARTANNVRRKDGIRAQQWLCSKQT